MIVYSCYHDLNSKKLVSHPKFQIGLCKKIVGVVQWSVLSKRYGGGSEECQNVGYAAPGLQ